MRIAEHNVSDLGISISTKFRGIGMNSRVAMRMNAYTVPSHSNNLFCKESHFDQNFIRRRNQRNKLETSQILISEKEPFYSSSSCQQNKDYSSRHCHFCLPNSNNIHSYSSTALGRLLVSEIMINYLNQSPITVRKHLEPKASPKMD